MEIKVATSQKPKVRYAVHYQDRNYEYALHSGKRHFVRNIADIVNILEYCIVQDLKDALYKEDEKLYNFDVIRMVNDKPDEKWNEHDKAYYRNDLGSCRIGGAVFNRTAGISRALVSGDLASVCIGECL